MDWVSFTTKIKMLPTLDTNEVASPTATYTPISFPGNVQVFKTTINGVVMDIIMIWRGSRDIPYGVFSLTDSLSLSGGTAYTATLIQAIYAGLGNSGNNLAPKVPIFDDYKRIYALAYNPDQPVSTGITTGNFITGAQIFDAFNSTADVAYFVFYFKNLSDALNAKGANP